MDADLQDPPEIIPEMVNRWENGYQVVTATRKLRRGESLFKRITAWIFYRLMRWLSDTPVEVNVGDFRLADRRVIDVIKQLKEQSLYLRGIFNWVGFRQTTVGYTRDPRYAGETKYSVKKMTGLAFDALISFSEKPLYMVLRVGATTTICAMVMFSYLLSTTIFNIGYRAPGWMSLVAILLLLGSVQLICLGIIGLYIGRIYRESKNRPRYIIDSEK
jgi:dolichol-phosphate mannosyltransferase